MKYFLSCADELLELAYYAELRELYDYAVYLLDCAVSKTILFFEVHLAEAPCWMTRIVYKIAVRHQLVEVSIEEWLDTLVDWQ